MTALSGPQREATSRRRFLAAAGTAAAVPAAAALLGGGPLAGTGRAATSGGLPDYAPIPPGALGPALNADGYFVGKIDGNLYWVTDSVYQALMIVDVIFPGWVPFKNLAVSQDIPDWISAQDVAMGYQWQTLVGDADRAGTSCRGAIGVPHRQVRGWPEHRASPDGKFGGAQKPPPFGKSRIFPERTVLLTSGKPVSESAAVPVMPSELTVCCGEGRSMLSV
jgi:hypothetical protein